MLEKWIVFLFLVAGAVWDIKKNSVPKIYLYIWGATAVLYVIVRLISGTSVFALICAFVPGSIGLVLAFITKEQIGIGDGLVLILMGAFLDVKVITEIMIVAFVVLTPVTIILLVLRVVGGKTRIPFIPFLLVGYLVCICGGGFV